MRRGPVLVLLCSLAAIITACTAGQTAQPARPQVTASGELAAAGSGGSPTDWLTYHGDLARSGSAHGLPAAGPLSVRWLADLDGAVYGQPLVIGGTVIAATENDSVYGLDWRTGHVRWRARLGTPLPLASQPCGTIDPLGITSTPVYDQATRLVYALAQNGRTGHLLAGLDPVTGAVRYRRAVPSPDRQPWFDQQRGALAAGSGRIYVTFGGHPGDCGRYLGSVVGLPDRGTGPADTYLVPTARQAGIWAPGGPVIEADGTVLVSVGNGTERPPYDRSDSVTALTPRLQVAGYFAPASWLADNQSDLDLGSMTPALVGGRLILVAGKSGAGYLLRASRLGGIGGQIATAPICAAFGSAAVAGRIVYLPCAEGGPAAVQTRSGRPVVLWRGPAPAAGSPVAGGGAIWVTGNGSGVLYELDPATGAIRFQLGLGSELPHFCSPALSGPLVLIGTMHGVVAVAGA